ncbi:phosphatidate cytidylyltransferase [Thermaurantiacus sp.]
MAGGQRRELSTRVVSALVLGAVALGALWQGGWLFAALVAVGGAVLVWEWGAMHAQSRVFRITAGLGIIGASWVAMVRDPLHGLAALGAILFVSLLWCLRLPPEVRRGWPLGLAGLLYGGLPAVALIGLRNLPDGFALVLWTMAIVWATDILAYFAGRAIGGPKLLPAVSPNKTWAGLAGGMAGAAWASALLAGWFWGAPMLPFLAAGAALAIVAQAGDLFESWLKRRAGVKDSGNLIPGHGGMMDRVDGLVPVAVVVGLFMFLARLPEGFWKNCEGCSA